MGWNPCCLFSTRWFPCSGGGFSEELRALQPLCDSPPRFLNPLGKHQQVVRPSIECWLDCGPGPFPQRHFPPAAITGHLLGFQKRRLLWLPCPWNSFRRKVGTRREELLPQGSGDTRV